MELNTLISALRDKYRFPSARGELVLEQLWEVPLTSVRGFSLNDIAKGLSKQLREKTEDNFVPNANAPTTEIQRIRSMLEIVVFVIGVRTKEAEDINAKRARQEKRARLLDALQKKESEELSQASKDDILKQLAELDA